MVILFHMEGMGLRAGAVAHVDAVSSGGESAIVHLWPRLCSGRLGQIVWSLSKDQGLGVCLILSRGPWLECGKLREDSRRSLKPDDRGKQPWP